MAYTLVPTELIVDGAITSAKLDTNIAISGTLGVTGEVTLATHLVMGDNDKIKIGTGGDLEIYHDGSNSYISNSTGNIYLGDTNGSVHIQAKLNEESIVCASDGAVSLYHDNAVKLATTSTGIDVTGDITADGLNIGTGVAILRHILSASNTDSTLISGGNTTSTGANYTLFGGTHATLANIHRWRIGGSEAARIDASGNFMIGGTNARPAEFAHPKGISFRGDIGQIQASTDANTAMLLNRDTSDGTIAEFRKDGSVVGVIGTENWGIGTSSPARELSIGDGTGSPNIQLLASTAGNSRIEFGDGDDSDVGEIQYVHSSNYMQFTTNGSERARLDASGNLLVGTTSSANTTDGVRITSGGYITIAQDAASVPTLFLNKITNDGQYIQFQKDGSEVGSIEVVTNTTSDISIGSDNVRLLFFTNGSAIVPRAASNASADNTIDLGNSDNRFKDLYLSGTAYIDTSVGIGGTPDTQLNIKNSDDAVVRIESTGSESSDDARLEIKTTNGTFTIQNDRSLGTSGALTFAGNTSNNLVIDHNSGNTGIGTSSPNAPLTVSSSSTKTVKVQNTTSSGTSIFVQNSTTGTGDTDGTYFGLDGSENAYLWNYESTNMVFGTSSTERLRIDSAGSTTFTTGTNDGVKITGAENSAYIDSSKITDVATKGTFIGIKRPEDGNVTVHGIGTYDTSGNAKNNLAITSRSDIVFASNDGEMGRFDVSGSLLVGTTSPVYSGGEKMSISSTTEGVGIKTTSAVKQCLGLYNSDTGGARHFVRFALGSAGSEVGSITSTGSVTAYNTSSDYRLKENVDYDFTALDRVAQLKPARFNFIADADKTVDGFLAHEVQDIVPEAITGEKDAVDDEGNPEYQGIDQSKLVPLLTKAIQEQQTIIDDLKTRIETLEG